MLDPTMQTIADMLYLRATLRLPPRPVKDREQTPISPLSDPVPFARAADAPSIDLQPIRYDPRAAWQAPWRWVTMTAHRLSRSA
jgi:hypothetical protein